MSNAENTNFYESQFIQPGCSSMHLQSSQSSDIRLSKVQKTDSINTLRNSKVTQY